MMTETPVRIQKEAEELRFWELPELPPGKDDPPGKEELPEFPELLPGLVWLCPLLRPDSVLSEVSEVLSPDWLPLFEELLPGREGKLP